MTNICHLFDATTGWEQRIAVSQSLDRMPADQHSQVLATIDPTAMRVLACLDPPIRSFPRLAGLNALAAPLVARFARRHRVDLIHAWGPHAAAVAAASGFPLVLELFDPLLARRHAKLIRALTRSRALAIICSCEFVRRRLIENGVPPDLCVVVRPGVDFAVINSARRGSLREKLGVAADEFLTIVPEPATRSGGQIEAFWATTLLNHAGERVRMIVPGSTPETERIARLATATPPRPALVDPHAERPFEELVSVADALIVAARGDASTTAIAWAMAADTAVIGAATHSVAELVANKSNGLLYKPNRKRRDATAIARLLWDRSSQEEAREVARGQAYEVFGLRRSIEQRMRIYANVLSGLTPGDGIVDSAIAG